MLVSDIMTRDLLTVWGGLSVREALERAFERDVHHLLIVEDGRLRGVSCVCDLRERPAQEPVRTSITRAPVVVWAQSSLREAAQRFIEKDVSCFPVCDGSELVGVVTRGDLRRSRIHEHELPNSFRCSFCGSTRHVRALASQPGFASCLECRDRTSPAAEDLFEEGTKD